MPSFNGSSYLRHPALGDSALSWLDLDIVFKTRSTDGLILYEGYQKYGSADFISVYMVDGHVEFTFDLGTGTTSLRYIFNYSIISNINDSVRLAPQTSSKYTPSNLA